MIKQPTHTIAIRILITLSLLVSVGVLALVNREVFDGVGWLEPATVCLLGGGSVLFVSLLTSRNQRKLLVPPGAIVALAAVLVSATWAYPSTPRTRFFADAAHVKVGMTTHDIRILLSKHLIFASPSRLDGYAPYETPVNSDSIPARFSGYLVSTPDKTSGDTASFQMRNGRVTNIYRYSNYWD